MKIIENVTQIPTKINKITYKLIKTRKKLVKSGNLRKNRQIFIHASH